jgi:PEP-CTERM motif
MKINSYGLASIALLLVSSSSMAGLNIFTSIGSFNTSAASYTFMGLENWNSGIGAGLVSFNDSLLPGVPNGPMPVGTNSSMGITVQSNSLGDAASTTSPVGPNGLAWASAGTAGFSGTPRASNQLCANFAGSSLDILFSTVGGFVPKAADLTPIFRQLATDSNPITIRVLVYDTSNNLLGFINPTNVHDVLEDRYVGFEVTGATTLGRINIAVERASSHTVGVDNIRVFGAVPEPGSICVIGIGIIGLIRRRKISK